MNQEKKPLPDKGRDKIPSQKTPDEASTDSDLEAKQFARDLVKRGQAAKAVNGKLPPGATHEIVGEDEEGNPIVVRRRFSAY